MVAFTVASVHRGPVRKPCDQRRFEVEQGRRPLGHFQLGEEQPRQAEKQAVMTRFGAGQLQIDLGQTRVTRGEALRPP